VDVSFGEVPGAKKLEATRPATALASRQVLYDGKFLPHRRNHSRGCERLSLVRIQER